LRAATLKVAHFHSLLNAGRFDQIAAEAGPELSWPARGPSFKDYLTAVHRNLGFCGDWRMIGFHQKLGSGGTTRLEARTHCERDDAIENFVFTGRGSDLRLKGYQITSRVLVVS
jgi:hypothetical protein